MSEPVVYSDIQYSDIVYRVLKTETSDSQSYIMFEAPSQIQGLGMSIIMNDDGSVACSFFGARADDDGDDINLFMKNFINGMIEEAMLEDNGDD